MNQPDDKLIRRAKELCLHGLVANFDKIANEPWLPELITWEEQERARRSLERRIKNASLGSFKVMADFDYSWPTSIDREQIADLFTLAWMEEAANVVIVGPNGIGKTMIAKNLVQQAVVRGYTARFLTASELLNTLAAQDSASALNRRLQLFCRPQLLAIDELGYLSYDNRHADLLFEVVSRRYLSKPILFTTNRPFREWNEVFPSATSVVTLVDRLVHRAEITEIEGESYRLKEARENAARKAKQRASRRRKQDTDRRQTTTEKLRDHERPRRQSSTDQTQEE